MLKLKLKLAAGLIIAALLIIFTLQNMTEVTVCFIIGGPVLIPLAYLLLASVLFGMGLLGIALLTRMLRLKGMQKRLLVQQEALRQISQNLMVQPNVPEPASLPQSQSQLQPEKPLNPSASSRASVENTVENTSAQGLLNNNHASSNARKDKVRNFNSQKKTKQMS